VKDLNRAQLQNELTRRWGKKGYATQNKHCWLKAERDLVRTFYVGTRNHKVYGRHKIWNYLYSGPCSVGQISNILFTAFMVEGNGDTWREAFAEVDRKAALDKARYAADRVSA
jgi:hypothetical protein